MTPWPRVAWSRIYRTHSKLTSYSMERMEMYASMKRYNHIDVSFAARSQTPPWLVTVYCGLVSPPSPSLAPLSRIINALHRNGDYSLIFFGVSGSRSTQQNIAQQSGVRRQRDPASVFIFRSSGHFDSMCLRHAVGHVIRCVWGLLEKHVVFLCHIF